MVSMEPSAQPQQPHSVTGPPHSATQLTGRMHALPQAVGLSPHTPRSVVGAQAVNRSEAPRASNETFRMGRR